MTVQEIQRNVVPVSAKWAFTTRRVHRADVFGLQKAVHHAVAGDLVLCEVVSVGQHKKLQLANQRYSELYPGDVLVACVGDRYAPDQFEGISKISEDGADLLAGGGVIGSMQKAHAKMSAPTKVRPIGLLVDAGGEEINISRYALTSAQIPMRMTVIGVFGASMNSGKTTAAVSLAHGLSKAGFRVAGVKATGTGAFGDFNALEDAGIPALDFTDAGMPTTYRMPMERIEKGFETLVGTAASGGADIAVVEFADGVFQRETAAILNGSSIKDRLDGVLFAAPDALSSAGGVELMRRIDLEPFAVSGMVTCSPLAWQEAALATGIQHLSREELCHPEKVLSAASPAIRAHLVHQLDVA